MARPQLRVYLGSDDSREPEDLFRQPDECPGVTVELGDVLPLLADAVHTRRAWIEDFAHDSVTLSADLYELLMAYQDIRRAG